MGKFVVLLIAFSFLSTGISIQSQTPICNDTVTVYLDETGGVDFNISENVLKNTPFDSVSPSIFSGSCSALGVQKRKLELFSDNKLQDTCLTHFQVLDSLPPFFINDISVNIQIQAKDTFSLSESDLVLYKKDNCGIQTIEISPNTFDTTYIGQTNIQITVTDTSGNSSIANTTLQLSETNCEKEPFYCRWEYFPSAFYGAHKVTYHDLISPYSIERCERPYTLTWLDGNFDTVNIPNNTLDENHIGESYRVYVTDTTNGDYCYSQVGLGDCIPIEHPSSHEFLPKDLTINLSCHNNKTINFDALPDDPEYLSSFLIHNFDSIIYNTFFFPVNKICQNQAFIENDTFIITDSSNYILREWSIWGNSGYHLTHFQKVFIHPGPTLFDTPNCIYDKKNVYLRTREYVEITKDLLLFNAKYAYICTDSIDLSFLDENEDSVSLPQNRIYKDLEHDTLYAVLTLQNSGKSCTTLLRIHIPEFSHCFKDFNVCDTLPPGQNFDHCDSSYSTSDRVEWPNDVTINTCPEMSGLHAEHVLMNRKTYMDAYPRVMLNGCDTLEVDIDYGQYRNWEKNYINRNWELFVYDEKGGAGLTYNYTQKIHLSTKSDCEEYEVFVSSPIGTPMEGVIFGDSLSTDENGNAKLENWQYGDSLNPLYSRTLKNEAVTLDDLILLYQALQKEVFLNPIQKIAADVDKNGKIDYQDHLKMRNHLINGEPLIEGEQTWLFVSLKNNLNLGRPSFGDYLHTVPEFSEFDFFNMYKNYYSFIGLHLGDLNSSAFMENKNEEVVGSFEDRHFKKGEEVVVPLHISGNIAVLSLEFKLDFNSKELNFSKVTQGGINNFDQSHYKLINDSTLIFDWSDSDGYFVKKGQREASGLHPLVNIHFVAQEDGNLSASLDIDTIFPESEIRYIESNLEEKLEPLHFKWENLLTNADWVTDHKDLKVYPNPASDILHLDNSISSSGFSSYRVIDMTGVIRIEEKQFNSTQIDIGSLMSGIYFLELNSKTASPVYVKFSVQK